MLINGERHYVAYKGLNHICASCGMYGHAVNVCPKRSLEVVVQRSPSESATVLNEGDNNMNGFTQVKNVGKLMDSPVPRLVFETGGSGEKVASNRHESIQSTKAKDLTTKNRF